MAKKQTAKKVLSEEQKLAMKAGRDKAYIKKHGQAAFDAKEAAKLNNDEEFVPTEVQDQLAQQGQDDLVEPTLQEGAETTDVLPTDNQPSSSAPQPTQGVDVQTITAIAVAVAQALQGNPQIQQATPDQKLADLESAMPNRPHEARIGGGGEVQGVVYKYDVSKDFYPDPTNQLLSESRLARFAMKENFIFRWSVDGVEYKKNNITYTEPRFTLELFRKIYNDEGDPTGKASLVSRQMLHEDEFTTRIMAMRLGVIDEYDKDDEGFRALMSAMRYERFKQWLFSIFTPPKIETHRKRPITQVINGKAVEVFDTETLIDASSAEDKTAALASQDGIGKIATPDQEPSN